jgi:hypothetical protein
MKKNGAFRPQRKEALRINALINKEIDKWDLCFRMGVSPHFWRN